jgi:hypothetical protein
VICVDEFAPVERAAPARTGLVPGRACEPAACCVQPHRRVRHMLAALDLA